MSNLVFIVGLDRSGSHLTADFLDAFMETTVVREEDPVWSWCRDMAADKRRIGSLFPQLVMHLKRREQRNGGLYVSKAHTALWIAGRLLEVFPTMKMLATSRGMTANVASMLDHGGVDGPSVVEFMETWNRYPKPNPFFGVDSPDVYERLTMETRLMLRWQEHRKRVDEMVALYPGRILRVAYESLCESPEAEAFRMRGFLGLGRPGKLPEIARKR